MEAAGYGQDAIRTFSGISCDESAGWGTESRHRSRGYIARPFHGNITTFQRADGDPKRHLEILQQEGLIQETKRAGSVLVISWSGWRPTTWMPC